MEQRQLLRLSVDWDLTLRQEEHSTHGRVLQFSEQGMFASPGDAARVGQHYDLTFSLPGYTTPFHLHALAAYATPQGVGLLFEQVPPEITVILRDYVKNYRPGQAAE